MTQDFQLNSWFFSLPAEQNLNCLQNISSWVVVLVSPLKLDDEFPLIITAAGVLYVVLADRDWPHGAAWPPGVVLADGDWSRGVARTLDWLVAIQRAEHENGLVFVGVRPPTVPTLTHVLV